jgi:hypothetical protein
LIVHPIEFAPVVVLVLHICGSTTEFFFIKRVWIDTL